MSERCKFKVGKYNCGSYAFNLYKEDIDQGDYCDHHYWQDQAQKARADEREAISDEWHSSVYSDLEHGVKCLNEQAAKDWLKNYPEISKFGAWLEARGEQA
jgi:oligoendopeptidase F